jgi:hypothetical protein
MVIGAPRTLGAIALMLLTTAPAAMAADATPSCATQPNVNLGLNDVASYRIVATLDPERHQVTGTATIRWRNQSDKQAGELYLHAYLNAFAHPRTRFLRAISEGRGSAATRMSPGGLNITRFVAHEFGDADWLPYLEAHSPDDPDDATDLRVALPFPVGPAQTLTLNLEFQATLPSLVQRSGFSGTFHAVTQWFPKIARHDNNGIWHHFPYTSLAEFSSDFGDYDVTIDVPAAFVIAAPGIALPMPARPGRRQQRYCLTNVHDFAWFAWDQFLVTTAKAGPVEIRHYASRDQTETAAITLETLRWGLQHFGERFFPYPYPSLTVVHPPDSASSAGGMEYPQLITTGGPWYLSQLGLRSAESLSLHELAHQWFYGMLASDEYLYPVLDEGLTSWAEADALGSRFLAGSTFDTTWFKISEAAARRVYARRYSRRGPLAIPANAFGDFATLVGRVYARFPTLLETLDRVYDDQQLVVALRAYAQQYRFGHPTPTDFLESIRPHLQPGAYAALSTALFSDGWVDFAVRRVTSTRLANSGGYSNRILVERRGTLDLPVLLEVEFADGHVARRRLESVDSNSWIDWSHSSPVVVATIDPDQRVTIDEDLENQTIRLEQRPALGRLATALHLAGSALWSLGWP